MINIMFLILDRKDATRSPRSFELTSTGQDIEYFLTANLSQENCKDILEGGRKYNSDLLVKTCMRFIFSTVTVCRVPNPDTPYWNLLVKQNTKARGNYITTEFLKSICANCLVYPEELKAKGIMKWNMLCVRVNGKY